MRITLLFLLLSVLACNKTTPFQPIETLDSLNNYQPNCPQCAGRSPNGLPYYCQNTTSTCIECVNDNDCLSIIGAVPPPNLYKCTNNTCTGGYVFNCPKCSFSNGQQFCSNAFSETCVECVFGTSGLGSCRNTYQPICSSQNTCEPCKYNSDCSALGSSAPICNPDGSCVSCLSNNDCPSSTPVCSNGACVQCVSNTDCSDGNTCYTGNNDGGTYGAGNICVCVPPSLSSDQQTILPGIAACTNGNTCNGSACVCGSGPACTETNTTCGPSLANNGYPGCICGSWIYSENLTPATVGTPCPENSSCQISPGGAAYCE